MAFSPGDRVAVLSHEGDSLSPVIVGVVDKVLDIGKGRLRERALVVFEPPIQRDDGICLNATIRCTEELTLVEPTLIQEEEICPTLFSWTQTPA